MKLDFIFLGFLFIIFLGAIVYLIIDMENTNELLNCKIYDNYKDVIFEDNLLFDKCLIIEDGEEFTIEEYKNKHKFDGLEVRK